MRIAIPQTVVKRLLFLKFINQSVFMNHLNNVNMDRGYYENKLVRDRETKCPVFADRLSEQVSELTQSIRNALQLMFSDHMHDLSGFKKSVKREIQLPAEVRSRIIKIAKELFDLESSGEIIETKKDLPKDPKGKKPLKVLRDVEDEVSPKMPKPKLCSDFAKIECAENTEAFFEEHRMAFLVEMLKNPEVGNTKSTLKLLSELIKSGSYHYPACHQEQVDDCIKLLDSHSDAEIIQGVFEFLDALTENYFEKYPELAEYISDKILIALTVYFQSQDEIKINGALRAVACTTIEKINNDFLNGKSRDAAIKNFYNSLRAVLLQDRFGREFLRQGGFLKLFQIFGTCFETYLMSDGDDKKVLEGRIRFFQTCIYFLSQKVENRLEISTGGIEAILEILLPQLSSKNLMIQASTLDLLGKLFVKFKVKDQIEIADRVIPLIISFLEEGFSIRQENKLLQEVTREESILFCLNIFLGSLKVSPILSEKNLLDPFNRSLLSNAAPKTLERIFWCLGAIFSNDYFDFHIEKTSPRMQEIYEFILENLKHNASGGLLGAINKISKKMRLPKEYFLEIFPRLIKLTDSPVDQVVQNTFYLLRELGPKSIPDDEILRELFSKIERDFLLNPAANESNVYFASVTYIEMFFPFITSRMLAPLIGTKSEEDLDPKLKAIVDLFLELIMTSPHPKAKQVFLKGLSDLCNFGNRSLTEYLIEESFDKVIELSNDLNNEVAIEAMRTFNKLALESRKKLSEVSNPLASKNLSISCYLR